MAKLKDHIIKQEEHRQLVLESIEKEIEINRRVKRVANKQKHQPEEFLFKPKPSMPEWKEPRVFNVIKRIRNEGKHQWREDMPDLEGKALADAEKQFDYDSWLGEHGIGE